MLMTEPLIVVEGTLRLPSLRPLADPLLRFGREWRPLHTRPPQSVSEVPFFAARLQTAYVKAISLADRDSPYRPVNIWGVFADGATRQSMLRLLQGLPPEEAEAPPAPSAQAAQRIPLTFQPPSSAYRPQHTPFFTPLKTAIALACAALLAWMLFGMHPDRNAAQTPVASTAQTAAAVKPTSALSVQIAPASVPVADAVASTPTPRSIERSAVPTPKPVAVAIAPPAEPTPVIRAAKTASKHEARKATQTHAKASASALKPVVSAKPAGVRKKTAGYRAEAPAYDDVYEVRPPRAARTVRDTQAPVHIPMPSRVIAPAAAKPYMAMDTKSLYDMLLHSPTLDSNVGAGASNR
jgi:hypothetical protein